MMNRVFQPKRMCAQIDDSLIVQFLGYWVNYGKPCRLTIVPSEKMQGIVGICFTVRDDDYATLEFMEKAVSKTGAKLWDLTKNEENGKK